MVSFAIFRRNLIFGVVVFAALGLAAAGQQLRKAYISFPDAKPLLALSSVPEDLKAQTSASLAARWPAWVARRDSETRARLERGEEDSLANLLMFGTSFTRQPRITPEYMQDLERAAHAAGSDPSSGLATLIHTLKLRVDDLMRALAAPGNDERLLTMRHVVAKKGYPVSSAGRENLRQYLMANLARVRQEYARYAQQMKAARESADRRQGFAVRSQLFAERGISLDTSLLPNYAIEQALQQLREGGLLRPGSVRRVGVIGPGLDYVDKDEGFDFYPPQTIQPFAVIDSLRRLGLASAAVRVVTLDISSRVNAHIARARREAQRGQAYTVQLPRDVGRKWNAAAAGYWEHFGDRIGAPAEPLRAPASAGELTVRAVRIRPEVVLQVVPADLDVIYQHLDLAPGQRFDLIVATNMFVYYDSFQQGLALLNVQHMLRPGGLLLSNDALPELPFAQMRPAGETVVTYSERAGDGDRVVWYRKM